jgi:FKBP-type peptidyl-prolyl cis-trans isomerase
MKKINLLAVLIFILLGVSCSKKDAFNKPLETQLDTISYTLGLDAGLRFRAGYNEVNQDLFVQGIIDGIDSTDIKIDKERISYIISGFLARKRQEEFVKEQEKIKNNAEIKYADIKQQGIDFMNKNKVKPNVKSTESGLLYIVIKEGTGDKPVATSNVTVHYHGTTPNGEVFDSSLEGNPRQFFVNQVIAGWREGLQLMNEGAKYKFFIPQELAYGFDPPRSGNGPIKPFMPLIFEVELIQINNKNK